MRNSPKELLHCFGKPYIFGPGSQSIVLVFGARSIQEETMHCIKKLVLASTFFLCSVAPPAASFPSVGVLGDSLSDRGRILEIASNTLGLTPEPVAPYFVGGFSNGPVAVEYLTDLVAPACLTIERNFACGGAKTGDDPDYFPDHPQDNNDPNTANTGLLKQSGLARRQIVWRPWPLVESAI